MGATLSTALGFKSDSNKLMTTINKDIENISRSITEHVNNIINNVSQEISQGSSQSTDIENEMEIGSIRADGSNSKVKIGNISQKITAKINFDAVSNALQNNELQSKLLDQVKNDFSQDSNSVNDIKNQIKNLSENLVKAEQLVPGILPQVATSIGISLSSNEQITNQDIKSKISNEILNKTINNISNNIKQNNNQTCTQNFKTHISLKIKDISATNSGNLEIDNIDQNQTIDIIAKCLNISNIGSEIIKTISEETMTKNIQKVTDETKNNNEIQNESKLETTTASINIWAVVIIILLLVAVPIIICTTTNLCKEAIDLTKQRGGGMCIGSIMENIVNFIKTYKQEIIIFLILYLFYALNQIDKKKIIHNGIITKC